MATKPKKRKKVYRKAGSGTADSQAKKAQLKRNAAAKKKGAEGPKRSNQRYQKWVVATSDPAEEAVVRTKPGAKPPKPRKDAHIKGAAGVTPVNHKRPNRPWYKHPAGPHAAYGIIPAKGKTKKSRPLPF